MRTLHSYAGKELLKTFLMTAVALTALVVMGGGVANLFRGEGAGAREMLAIFLFLTPVAITLILPVASLFSAAITYGRMAADNEVLACSAAGINIHRLLLSAVALGVFVTGFTYWSWNFMIPDLTRRIEEAGRRDLPMVVMGQFQKAKPLTFSKYRIMANRCDQVPREQLPPEVGPHRTFLQLTGVSFIEVEDQEPIRWGTADRTLIEFDNSDSHPKVTVDLQDIRSFDASRRQYYELRHQILGPFEIPHGMRYRTKFENLWTLLEFRRRPELIPEIDDRLHNMKREMMGLFLADDIEAVFSAGEPYILRSDLVRYEITTERYQIDEHNGRPTLANVTVIEQKGDRVRRLRAARARIDLRSSWDRANPFIEIRLSDDVVIHSLPRQPGDHEVRKSDETLQTVPYLSQDRLRARIESFDVTCLLSEATSPPLRPHQAREHRKLLEAKESQHAKVLGEIHFRASYSVSAVAVILFGAVLGIIVRGGQVLTAFGISCVPMVFVVVAEIVGRNLVDRPGYALISIGIMWGATAFMYLAAAFVALRVLKR